MTKCDADSLSLFLDGELPPARFREIANHLRQCPQCRDELAGLRQVSETLRAWGSLREPVSIAAQARVHHSVERRSRVRPLFGLSRMMPAAVGTSVAALLVLVSVNFAPLYQSTAHDTQRIPSVAARTLKKQSTPLMYARVKSAVLSPHGVPDTSVPVGHARPADIY